MTTTRIRQLHPRSRPTSPNRPHDASGPVPDRPSALLRAALHVAGSASMIVGVCIATVLAHQLWWLDAVAADRSEVLITSVRADFTSAAALGPASTEQAVHAPSAGTATVPAAAAPAIVHLPTIGETQPVLEGVGADVLDQGVLGHYPGTARAGEAGTFAVAGHRTTYGRPLWALGELEVGDPIVVETEGSYLVYEVRSLEVVSPDDTSVLTTPTHGASGAGEEVRMVLTTCHPRFSAAQRLVAVAVLARSVPRAHGAPAEIAG